MRNFFLIVVMVLGLTQSHAFNCAMPGNFLKVIKDTCYPCMFPMYVAGVPIGMAPVMDGSATIRTPICFCGTPVPRVGIPWGYWNPNRFIEVVKTPWCFPLIGAQLGVGYALSQRGTRSQLSNRTFMQAHYYIYPLFTMLEIMTDFACLASSAYDVGYITEIDPLWSDDELAFFINPEALLFGNIVALMACIADSVASNVTTPLSTLFWCKGSWGGVYPMTGNVAQENVVEDAASIAANLIFKMNRQGILLNGGGISALCGKHYQPIWNKDNFRLQLLLPQSHFMCMPIGRDALFWSILTNLPSIGVDNFGFLMFQKRDCCVL